MTTQTAIIITQDYGSSLSTPTLRNYLTDTLITAADSANEVTADSGRYALVFDETSVHAAGWYGLRAFVSGAPINRFVYFTGVDGETAIAVDNLPVGVPQVGQLVVTRNVGDTNAITFSFPVASATLTGTRRINNAGSTTSLSGALSFLRSDGSQHLYSLAYDAADRPEAEGVVKYDFTDGTYTRSIVLRAVTVVLDSASIVRFVTEDTGETTAADGSVAKLSQGSSGSGSVTVLPATGIVANRAAGVTLLPVIGETISQAITVYQSDGTTAVDLSGKTLRIIFETMSGVDVAVVQAADITIGGTGSNVVTFAYPATVTASERTLRFAIRDAAAPLTMYLQGVCSVIRAPQVDA